MTKRISKRSLSLLALLVAACGAGDAERSAWPEGLDPLVRERLEAVLEERERGQAGAELELAKTYEANGMPELALRAYERCLVLGGAELGDGAPQVRYRRACCLEDGGRLAEALEAFEEVRRLVPDYAPAHWRAGNLLLDQGRGPEARAAFERALALEPGGIAQTLGLARAQLNDGEAAAARATLEPLVASRPRERFGHGLLARALRALGDESGAAAALQAEERAVEQAWSDPWTAEVRRRRTGVAHAVAEANELLLAGKAREAEALLQPVHERVPDDFAATQLLLKARIEAGALVRANELLERAREQWPEHFKLDYFAGLLALKQKDLPRAKRELLASLARNPAFGSTHAVLGEVELRLGALPEAEAAFERALEQGESDLRTRTLHAQVEIQLGKLERACELLAKLRADFPASVVPLAHLAEAQARRGEVEAARATLAEAERIDASFAHLGKVRELLATAPGGR